MMHLDYLVVLLTYDKLKITLLYQHQLLPASVLFTITCIIRRLLFLLTFNIDNMISSFFKPKPKRDRANNSTTTNTDKNYDGSKNNNNENKRLKTNHNKKNQSDETSKLISYLDDPTTTTNHSPNSQSWKGALDKHLSSSSFGRLASFVESERYVVYLVACFFEDDT